jgi:uncharacterized membrane protein YbhN (UPF0104 family)
VAGLDRGEPAWLTAALLLEVASFLSYVVLFRAVIGREAGLDWRTSYRITFAGLAATRLLAAGGAGGILLTAWALRREGLPRPLVAERMATLLVLIYFVFMAAVIVAGLGLHAELLPGASPLAFTLVPASLALLVVAICLGLGAWGGDLQGLGRRLDHPDRGQRWRAVLATVPHTLAEGVNGALAVLRRSPADALGALGWWAFDVAVLWACLHAFGAAPPVSVIVMAYFVGMTANLLPLPGGIGGVEGGMIGTLIAFDVPGGQALVAVLSYRAFAFWLPTVPGVIAYLGLLRSAPAEAS